MKLVVDAVVLVRALLDPASRYGKLVFDVLEQHELITSPEVEFEYLDVLGRPALARKFKSLANRDIGRIHQIIGQATRILLFDVPAVCRDRGDDHLLATARAGQADVLVTEDKDLLVLGDYFATRIMTVQDFFRSLGMD